MPDSTILDALETELAYAKQLAPGGQKADPGRIAAIEAQIKLYQSAPVEVAESTDDKSNKSTDYASNEEKPEDKAKVARGRQAKLETADATPEDVETADA